MVGVANDLPGKQQFSEQLNSVFRTHFADDAEAELHLIEFQDLVATDVQENFTLLFRGPADAPAVQAIYHLVHDNLGAMDLFLVPVKRDEKGLYYEAVFNRFFEPASA